MAGRTKKSGICIFDVSAVRLWRHFDNRIPGTPVFGPAPNAGPVVEDAFPSRMFGSVDDASSFDADPAFVDACDFARWGLSDNEPVHLLVARGKRNRSLPNIVLHSSVESTRKKAFLQVSKGVFAPSPEYLFAQQAERNDFVSQVLLGFELAGCYSIQPNEDAGLAQRHPLCSKESLESMLDGLPALRGRKYARRALSYVAEGSGSPRETALTLLLCLPMRYGGFGLPYPELNYRIDLGGRGSLFWGAKNAFDLVWRDAMLIVEYDGFESHEGVAARERDHARRDAAIAAGYTVLVVDKRQLLTVKGTYAVAKAVEGKLGVRMRFRDGKFRDRHLELRRRVLGPHV